MTYGDGNSERQRSSTEITHRASEDIFLFTWRQRVFKRTSTARDTPTSKCIRKRENIVHPVNGFGIHSTAHVDDDRDLFWPALLSEARDTGVAVLNCSDGYGCSCQRRRMGGRCSWVFEHQRAVIKHFTFCTAATVVTADPHATKFCHQTLARVAPPPDMDAISCRRRCDVLV